MRNAKSVKLGEQVITVAPIETGDVSMMCSSVAPVKEKPLTGGARGGSGRTLVGFFNFM